MAFITTINSKIKSAKGFYLFVILVSCNLSDEVKQLSGNCFFVSEGPKDQIIEGEDFWIPCHVTNYAYNDDFIVAEQIPTGECFRDNDNFDYSKGKDSTYYWIVIHREGLLIGPLTKDEFKSKMELYSVPADLRLEGSVLR